MRVNAGDAALGVLIAGIGRRIRDHQYRALIELDDPLDGMGELVLGVFRCGIVAFEHLDQLKLLRTPLTEPLCDFLLRLARGYADGENIESAQHCWRTVLKLTNNRSFRRELFAGELIRGRRPARSGRYVPGYRRTSGPRSGSAASCSGSGECWHCGARPDWVAAREHFETCVGMWPGCGMAWVGLASARAREGDRVGALSALKRCLLLPEDESRELGDGKQAAEVLLHDLGPYGQDDPLMP